MRVLVFEPGYCPYIAFFKDGHEAVKRVLRAEREVRLPFGNEVIALVCSKNQQALLPNRAIDEQTVIHGRFFVCGWDGEKLRELTRKQADRYYRRYIYPERYEQTEAGLQIIPLGPRVKPGDERLGRKQGILER